jgi:TolB protein
VRTARSAPAENAATALNVLALASVLLVVGCAGGGDEADGDQASRIAFTVNRSGFGEIWVMDADGRNRIRLTDSSRPDVDASGSTSPAWSPDGESIAFSHLPGSGTEEADGVIVVMSADGRDRKQLTRHADGPEVVFDMHPAWSPDGSLIAFTRATFAPDGELRIAIHTVDPAEGRERLLIEDAGEPAWSPDGRSFAFTSIRDRTGKTCFHDCTTSGEIYVARADGTALRRLTTSQADDRSPSWAPDGRRIAFVSDRSNREDHENEIYVVRPDGTDLRRLTTNEVWDLEPAWG